MHKFSIIGHFAFGYEFLDGQTIKTKTITKELENQLGAQQVLKIDTHGGKKTLFKAPFQVFKALKKSSNVIIFPAHNGLRVYAPLLVFFKTFFKKRKIHYVVIGGWLAKFLENKKLLVKNLKKFDGIYVETSTMKTALEVKGFTNVFVIPNCKELTVLKEEELVYANSEPYKLCTFSRVCKQKGIEDAINAVIFANEHFGRTVYSLDIYGQVDKNEIEWFNNLQKNFPSYIKYGGLVPFDRSVEVLKNYFALLFPTRFYTEGIPGTILDAYAAGLPIISVKWLNFSDILDDCVCIGYDFESQTQLKEILISENLNERLNALKVNCLNSAKKYLPNQIIKEFISRIE